MHVCCSLPSPVPPAYVERKVHWIKRLLSWPTRLSKSMPWASFFSASSLAAFSWEASRWLRKQIRKQKWTFSVSGLQSGFHLVDLLQVPQWKKAHLQVHNSLWHLHILRLVHVHNSLWNMNMLFKLLSMITISLKSPWTANKEPWVRTLVFRFCILVFDGISRDGRRAAVGPWDQ